MFRARAAWVRFSNPSKLAQTGTFTINTTAKPSSSTANNNSDKIESNVAKNDDAYRQLDKLDFMTAAKILFTDPPKQKKFGLDFHLVQLFFVCMPSLAVYLVAQYARYEMRKMEAELEQKKKKEEEEKAKEMELNATEEEESGFDPQLLEVKVRLDKLEETIKEIVVESKKQLGETMTKNKEDDEKSLSTSEPGNSQSRTESSISAEESECSNQKSTEVAPGLNQGKGNGSALVSDAPQQLQKGKTSTGGRSPDAKR